MKKNKIFNVFCGGICLIFCLVFALYSFELGGVGKVANQSVKMRVCLDAGHGGIDGGVVGSTGVTEAEINLQITLKLGELLQQNGIEVFYTRKDSNAFSPFKKEDMRKRSAIINGCSPHAVISIHCNSYRSMPSRRGVQVFYDDTGRGKSFAENMQRTINEQFNMNYSGKKYSALGGDYYLTKCCAVPSIIIECGFLSNKQDESLLQTQEYQSQLCDAILKCLKEFKAN